MSERMHGNTREILERIAAGHSPKSIADSLGVCIQTVYNCKNRHADALNRIMHRRADGTPDTFPPGSGCESIHGQHEDAVENPAESSEPIQHSLGELIRRIKELEAENKTLSDDYNKLMESQTIHQKAPAFDEKYMLKFMLDIASDTISTREFISGAAVALKCILGIQDPNTAGEMVLECRSFVKHANAPDLAESAK